MGTKTRPPSPAAVRAEAVQLVRGGGRPLTQAAQDLGVHHDTLRTWVRQAAIDEGRRDGLTTEERRELARLRREDRGLKEEREILKEAARFFAAERATRGAASGSAPRRRAAARWRSPAASWACPARGTTPGAGAPQRPGPGRTPS